MITIGKPVIEQIGDDVFFKSHVVDEGQNIEDDLFFKTSINYGTFFSGDVADAFLIGLLQPAIRHNQSIIIDGIISERLAYNLPTIQHVLALGCCVNENAHISISFKDVSHSQCKSTAVGCGCSLGVDSFAAMKRHLEKDCPSDHRITHLTFFNVGAMGYCDLEKAKESFEKDLRLVQSFASTIGLPVVTIESNISKWHSEFDFDDSGHFRNMSAILSMQNLFGRYVYASSFPIREFHFDHKFMGYYESLLFPLLSTERTEIIISNPEMTRIDKTRYIINDTLVHDYLYVCWKELIANRWPNSDVARIKDRYQNCSRCDKCKRTLLAIDLLGKLSSFDKVFDIAYWNTAKDSFIAKVLINRENSSFYSELQDLMRSVGYRPSVAVKKEIFKRKYPFLAKGLKKLHRLAARNRTKK